MVFKKGVKTSTKRRSSNLAVRSTSVRKKATSGGNTPMQAVLFGTVYGAGRGFVSRLISPLTDKIPLGQYADEVGMGIFNFVLAKGYLGNNSTLKKIGLVGLTIESSIIGNALAQGGLNVAGVNTSTRRGGF